MNIPRFGFPWPCSTSTTERDLLISRLHTEIESRDHAIQEIARPADALQSAAEERFAAMAARVRRLQPSKPRSRRYTRGSKPREWLLRKDRRTLPR
jgi:hypothetical protein